MRVTLRVVDGPHLGRHFTFAQHDVFLVGRSSEAHFSLPNDGHLSRLHFLIEVNPPLARLLDLNSKNGTTLNDREITHSANLSGGDTIGAGKSRLVVEFSGPDGETMPTASLEAVPAPPTEPTLPAIPGYTLGEQIGRGGMGAVYRARSEADGSPVAVKIIAPPADVRPTPTMIARFLREADILRQLRHRYIVPFRTLGEVSGQFYFVMDLIPGRNASEVIEQEGPLDPGRAVRLTGQVLEALAHAHQSGFVHRDIKPGNLLVLGTGPAEEVRLIDFGLARTYLDSPLSGLTVEGYVCGSLPFMAPEQASNFRSAQPACDQYAAAASLCYFLTGTHLFDGITSVSDLFRCILHQEPRPLEERRQGLPGGLYRAVARALSRRPADRFPDVQAFRNALLACGLTGD